MKTYKDRIHYLLNASGKRRWKYQRNIRMYTGSPNISLESLNDSECVGYFSAGMYNDIEDDLTSTIKENIIKSCIDTLVSKIASQKVRPFFNAVNASFKDLSTIKQCQQYFDLAFDEWDMNKVVTGTFKDACVFDTGYIYININDKCAEKVLPWQIYEDPIAVSYGRSFDVAYERKTYPSALLDLDYKSKNEYVTYIEYWNIKDHKHAVYIPEDNVYKEDEYSYDLLPFVVMHYSNPVKGKSCNSIVDDLYGIQLEIDSILQKIKDASQLTPANTIFVPEAAGISPSKISNRIGEVIPYRPQPSISSVPVMVSTPSCIDKSYVDLLQQLKQDAYEIVGISQLSATSQKPKGLDSGVALSTMEDIESERFEVQLNQVIRSYVEVAKKCIDLFDGDILPNDKNRKTIKWKDVKKANKKMIIQFSAAESLSKDPSEKLKQLQALVGAGVIPQTKVAQLMELPDLQTGYSIANNAQNAVMTVIERCIEHDDYDVPVFIPPEMLQEEIVNCCLSLEAANAEENYEDVQKLLKLYETVENIKMERAQRDAQVNDQNAQLEQTEMMGQQYDNAAAQIDEIANQVQSGQMDPETAQQMMTSLTGQGQM